MVLFGLAPMLAGESIFSDKTLSAVVAIFAFGALIVIIMRRSTATASREAEPARQPRRTSPEAHQPLRGEAERLRADLEEFGREIEGRLETRIRHITRLLAEADKAVEKLNARIEAANAAAAGPERPPGKSPGALSPQVSSELAAGTDLGRCG